MMNFFLINFKNVNISVSQTKYAFYTYKYTNYSLYYNRPMTGSGILSQWSFLRIGVMWWCVGVLVTARARAF